jgi:hypothetical protein
VVGGLISLLLNDRCSLRYNTASSLIENGIVSVASLIGHGSVTFGSVWIEPTGTNRASIWTVLAPAKVKALKELEKQWGCTAEQ